MSGGGALGQGGKEAVPGWGYVDLLDGSGGKTHWRCRFCLGFGRITIARWLGIHDFFLQ